MANKLQSKMGRAAVIDCHNHAAAISLKHYKYSPS